MVEFLNFMMRLITWDATVTRCGACKPTARVLPPAATPPTPCSPRTGSAASPPSSSATAFCCRQPPAPPAATPRNCWRSPTFFSLSLYKKTKKLCLPLRPSVSQESTRDWEWDRNCVWSVRFVIKKGTRVTRSFRYKKKYCFVSIITPSLVEEK